MEPDHPFVIARLAGVFLCALPAVRELYQYVNNPKLVVPHSTIACCMHPKCDPTVVICLIFRKAVRMGQHCWLLLATIGTELLAIVKWSKGQFPEPLPTRVKWGWAIGAALLVLYPTVRVCSVNRLFLLRLRNGIAWAWDLITDNHFVISCVFDSLDSRTQGDILGSIRERPSRRHNREMTGLV